MHACMHICVWLVLLHSNPMEAVKPKYTYNPALQNLYRAVLHRLQHPDEPSLPPVPSRPPLMPAITAVH
jgi:hypothetical protein